MPSINQKACPYQTPNLPAPGQNRLRHIPRSSFFRDRGVTVHIFLFKVAIHMLLGFLCLWYDVYVTMYVFIVFSAPYDLQEKCQIYNELPKATIWVASHLFHSLCLFPAFVLLWPDQSTQFCHVPIQSIAQSALPSQVILSNTFSFPISAIKAWSLLPCPDSQNREIP